MHADFLKHVNTWKFTRKAQKVLAFLPPVGELQIVYRLSIFFFFKLQGLNCLEPRHILDKRVCVGEPGGGAPLRTLRCLQIVAHKICPSSSDERRAESFRFINSRLKRNYLPMDINHLHQAGGTERTGFPPHPSK